VSILNEVYGLSSENFPCFEQATSILEGVKEQLKFEISSHNDLIKRFRLEYKLLNSQLIEHLDAKISGGVSDDHESLRSMIKFYKSISPPSNDSEDLVLNKEEPLNKADYRLLSMISYDIITRAKKSNLIDFSRYNGYLDLNTRRIESLSRVGELGQKFTEFSNLVQFLSLASSYANKSIYFPFFKDFRGRNYSYCPSHPITNKTSRAFLSQPPKPSLKGSLYSSNYFKTIIGFRLKCPEFLVILEEFASVSRPNLEEGAIETELELIYYFNTLVIEVFKFYKKSFLLKTGSLPLGDVLLIGFLQYRERRIPEFASIDERVYYNRICESLDTLVSDFKVTNVDINRDSTASFIQHWSYLLKPKDLKSLELLNLSGTNLNDFYYINISKVRLKFLEFADKAHQTRYFIPNPQRPSFSDPTRAGLVYDFFITRGSVKKPLMTSNYGVSFVQSREYFMQEIRPKIGSFIDENSSFSLTEVMFWLEKISRDLFNYSKEDVFKEFFVTSRDSFIKKSKYSFSYEGVNVDYSYFSPMPATPKRIQKRGASSIKYQKVSLSDVRDDRKTNQAVCANIIHTQDSLLADFLLKNNDMSVDAVHDSFKTSIHTVHILMDEGNAYFAKRLVESGFHTKEYSPFIFV